METLNNMRIGIASDHAGFELKAVVKEYLEKQGAKVEDFGTNSAESCDYPDFAHPLASAVERGECEFGVAICGSANGISMTVNKHQGCRAAICWKTELAALARQHNNANVLSLPARFIEENEALEVVKTFFSTDFEGGRHQRRIDKIAIK
ncbi:MAG: ribose 5-phosphate isomerase B [Paludibacteraceae bacterium]|nr:ribose 5-phosphate isomerase B [Paludibacteraceae bacterium]